jgi:high affinity Mn2+ porin
MDESIMVGASLQGFNWSRELDAVGLAYHVGRLTGNHRLAHEKGYASAFDRTNGIGNGNYSDETVLEAYYRFGLSDSSSISADYQLISNFNYDQNADTVNFMALRYNLSL